MTRTNGRGAKARFFFLTGVAILSACAPPPRWVAVALPRENSLLIFDGELTRARHLALVASPQSVVFGGDGSSLLVSLALSPGEFALSYLPREGSTFVATARISEKLKVANLSRDGRTAYLLSGGQPGALAILDLATLAQSAQIETCRDPVDLAVMRDQPRAFVLCTWDEIAEVDLKLGLLVRRERLETACGARGFFLSANETALVVFCAGTGRLQLLDRVRLVPFDSAMVESGEARLVPVLGRRGAALIYGQGSRVVVVELPSGKPVATLPLPGVVYSAAASAGGRFIYLATDTQLLRIDARRRAIDRRVSLSTEPAAVAVWPGEWESKLRFWR